MAKTAAWLAAHRARRMFATEDLKALMASGVTQTEAARRLGVTQAAVAHRLGKEGLTWPARRRVVDDETFARLWACRRITTDEIAEWMGVTRAAVSWRARHRGLPSRAKVRRRKHDPETLKAMWLAGVSSTDIAAHFGLASRSCVSRAVKMLGLPRRKRMRGAGVPGGWVGHISLAEWREGKLAEAMRDAVASRRVAA